MEEVLKSEISKIKELVEMKKNLISDEMAFNFLILQYFCYNSKNFHDNIIFINDNITDEKNDGGIDFVYFDEDESKIIIGQNKYTYNINNNDVVAELRKIFDTIKNFNKGRIGSYNDKLKRNLIEALDRLGEENDGNIEIYFSSLKDINSEIIFNKITEEERSCVSDIRFFSERDIEDRILSIQDTVEKVNEFKFEIDKAKNFLEYSNGKLNGIFVNISHLSLQKAYNLYKDKGLFDLNIRRYIRNKAVDDKIKETLENSREDFWFLNNGLTIACNEYKVDGKFIKLYDFSIVNGGQTTNLIGTYTSKKNDSFYIPCKIIMPEEKIEKTEELFSKIAEATNSQKPIQPKDLKSNAPEMKRLKSWLFKEYRIDLEIKRGEKKVKRNDVINIKNDELAQIINSFVLQGPGTSRSNKKALFSTPKKYNAIFRKGYEKDKSKKEFLSSLIVFYQRYICIILKILESKKLPPDELNVFNNGKQVIFALLGVMYRLVNNDINLNDLKDDSKMIEDVDFVYGKFQYKEDDIDERLINLILDIVEVLNRIYEEKKADYNSVSNFFKTDKVYIEHILNKFSFTISKKDKDLKEFLENAEILKRI